MAKAQVDGYTPRMKKHYEEVVRPKLIEEFGYKNPMEVPTIEKIVLNMGVGESTATRRRLGRCRSRSRRPEAGDHEGPQGDLAVQGPREHADRRQGHAAQGPHVRVPRPPRHHRAPARPRLPGPEPQVVRRPRQLRDGYQGAPGVPEINYDKVEQVWGMDVIITTTAKTDDEARALLRHFNFPFRQ